MPGPVAQSVVSLIADPGVVSLIPARPNSRPSDDSKGLSVNLQAKVCELRTG